MAMRKAGYITILLTGFLATLFQQMMLPNSPWKKGFRSVLK